MSKKNRTATLFRGLPGLSNSLMGPTKFLLSIVLATGALSGTVFTAHHVQANSFPAEFELGDLLTGDGTEGFVLKGFSFNDLAGYAVSAVGDLNGDGIDDFAVTSPPGDVGSVFNAGETYVVYGRDTGFPPTIELSQLEGGDGTTGFVIKGTDLFDLSGTVVSAAGDVNGDGRDDLLIGAPEQDSVGKAYVLFGRVSNFPAIYALADLAIGDGSEGFVLYAASSGNLTSLNLAAGNVNGDSYNDIIIGSTNDSSATGQRVGRTYILFGGATGFPAEFELASLDAGDGSTGFVVNGSTFGGDLGISVATGDVNGDEVDDVIINASPIIEGTDLNGGRTFVLLGRTTPFPAEFDAMQLVGGDGSEGYVIDGTQQPDPSFYTVLGTTDINGDGLSDILVGIQGADVDGRIKTGQCFVVYGRQDPVSSIIELDSLSTGNGAVGFVINGIDEGDEAGWSVSSAGDFNADGIEDLIVGAREADPNGLAGAGESYVIYGRVEGFPAVFELSGLIGGAGEQGFIINGVSAGDFSGYAVSNAGDVNNDNVDDILVGATGVTQGTTAAAGESYVIFGRAADSDGDGISDNNDNCTFAANSDQRDSNGDGFGNLCDPDLNNDGIVNYTDVVLWSEHFNTISDGDEDLNGDGLVNFGDYVIVITYFLSPPGPSGLTH